MRRVDKAAGTLSDIAVCELPSGLDAVRAFALRDAVAGVVILRVGLDTLGGTLRKLACGSDLDLCSLCASFVGSTVLSTAFSRAVGRVVSAESSCVTSRTGTNWPVPPMVSCSSAASLSNGCGAAAGCLFVKYLCGPPPLNIDDAL